MRSLLAAIVFVGLCVSANACDTFTSVEAPAGQRTFSFTEPGVSMRLIDKGASEDYDLVSAGTGSGVRVAMPKDKTKDGVEVSLEDGKLNAGGEIFEPFCEAK